MNFCFFAKSLHFRILLGFLATLGLYIPHLEGQISGEPLRVPVQFASRASYPNPEDSSQTHGNVRISLAGKSTQTPTSAVPVNSPVRTVYLEPGKEYIGSYQMNYSRPWEGGFFAAPPGYAIYINGKKRNDLGISGQISPTYQTFKLRVVNEARLDAPIGAATSLSGGRILWEVSLGRKLSGESAGNLLISYDGIQKAHWEGACTAQGLVFDTDSVESDTRNKFTIYKPSENTIPTLRQIQGPQAIVSIVTIDSSTYEIRFYHPSQITTAGNPAVLAGNPFIVYEVKGLSTWADPLIPGSADAPILRITKSTRTTTPSSVTASIDLTETTFLRRTTNTNGKFEWTAESWWNSGAANEFGRPVTKYTVDSTGLVETIEAGVKKDSNQAPIGETFTVQAKETRTYANLGESASGDENWKWTAPIQLSAAGNSTGTEGPSHAFTLYYDNPVTTEVASRGFVYGKRDIGGGWEYYDYSDTADIFSLGKVMGIYSPFLNQSDPSPAESTPETRVGPAWTTGAITQFTYSADESGIKSRLASSTTQIDGTVVEKTLNYYTTNTNTVDTVSRVYSNPGSTDTTQAALYVQSGRRDYLPSVENGLHTGRPVSETAPDGARISYIRHYVAWNATNLAYENSTTGKYVRFATVRGWESSIPADTVGGTKASILVSTYRGFDLHDLYVVEGLSTLSEEIYDPTGDLILSQTFVWKNSSSTAGNWDKLSSSTYTYNRDHTLASTTTYNGPATTAFESTSAVHSAGRLISSTDSLGLVTTYGYDAAGRVSSITKAGFGDTPAIRTLSYYDGLRHLVEKRTGAPDTTDSFKITGMVLRNVNTFDLAGRLKTDLSPGGFTTGYAYDPINRTTTTTAPTGATRIETTYKDGRLQRVQGSALIPEFHDYSIVDARLVTAVRSVKVPPAILAASAPNPTALASDRVNTQTNDALGRSIKTSRPKPPGYTGTHDEIQAYNTKGQLTYSRRPVSADTVYSYDAMGRLFRSGGDINSNTYLDLGGVDRISDKFSRMEYVAAAGGIPAGWWIIEEAKTYEATGSATATLSGKTRKRITGLTASLRSEEELIDAEGNKTTSTAEVDVVNRAITKKVQSPGLANPATEKSVNGFITEQTSPDNLTTRVFYDTLGRPYLTVAPRTGATRTYYLDGPSATSPPAATTTTIPTRDEERVPLNGANQPTGAGTLISSNIYDTTTGQLTSTKDSDLKNTYYGYNLRGQILRIWGEAAQPIEYDYNDFGDRTALKSYRAGTRGPGTGWNASTWPTGNTGSADITTWNYDDASGVLLAKKDGLDGPSATSGYVSYEYDEIGRVKKRNWGRFLPDQPTVRVTTEYSYANGSGDLARVDYNDGTAPLVYTYTRAGRASTVTDLLGTRTFSYDTANARPWRLDRETLADGRVFNQLYETVTTTPAGGSADTTAATVLGRNRGFEFGTSANPALYLTQTYTTGALGRLTAVTNGQTFTYSYLANSRLISGYSTNASGLNVIRAYESSRDTLTEITTKWGTGNPITSYKYWTDDRDRRRIAFQSGSLFADYGLAGTQGLRHDYAYDSRGQLTGASTSIDTAPTGISSIPTSAAIILGGRRFAYAYDEAGNRTASTRTNGSLSSANAIYDTANQLTQLEPQAAVIEGLAPAAAVLAIQDSATNSASSPTEATGTNYWHHELSFLQTAAEWRRYGRRVFIGALQGGTSSLESRFVFFGGRGETLQYDADGNLTRDDRWEYQWDAENRLIRQTTRDWLAFAGAAPRQRLEFAYDYLGRRVSKRVITLDSTNTPVAYSEIRFYYRSWTLIAEASINPDGNFGLLQRSYTWGLDLTGNLSASGGIGGLLRIQDHLANKAFFPAYDGNGNVVSLIDSGTGAANAAYEYSPYGESLRTPTIGIAAANPFRFSTQYTDAETGLIYYGMRYYDSAKGRFINRDPIEERGGLNLYGFCGNDSVNGYDVLGMWNPLKKLKKWFKKHTWALMLTTIVLGAITGGYALTIAPAAWGSVGAAAFAGGISGFTSGFTGGVLTGQHFGDSLLGGLKGAALGAVTGAVMAKATEWLQAKFTPAENQNMDLYHIRRTNTGIERDLIDTNTLAPEELSGKLWINGQSNDLKKAIELGFRNTNADEFYMGWNRPTSGLMDTVESVLDKISGQSPISRSAAKILSKFDLPNTQIYAHSQGTLIVRNAVAMRAAAGQAIKGVTVAYEGAAVNLISTQLAFSKIDAKLIHFGTHPFDAVPNLIGYNALTMPNPYRLVGSILSLPLLGVGGEWSPHTYPGGGQHLRFFPDAY